MNEENKCFEDEQEKKIKAECMFRQHMDRVLAPHDHIVLFVDRDGGGVSILPAVRRATVHVKNPYKMHFAAKSGPCAGTPRSR